MYKKIVTMAKGCFLNVKANAMQLDFVYFPLVVDFIINFKGSLHPF